MTHIPAQLEPIDAALTSTTGRFFKGTDEEFASLHGYGAGVELMGVTRTDTLHIRIAFFDTEGDCWAQINADGRWSPRPAHTPLRYRSWEFWNCNVPEAARKPDCGCAFCSMLRSVLGEPS